MNTKDKNRLADEAQMQMNALRKIGRWKCIAIAVSTLGAAAVYAGISGTDYQFFLCIMGIVILLGGTAAALVLNLGIRNGKRNVEKILNMIK